MEDAEIRKHVGFLMNRPLERQALQAVLEGVAAPWTVLRCRAASDRTWDRVIQKLRRRGLVEHTKAGWKPTEAGKAVWAFGGWGS